MRKRGARVGAAVFALSLSLAGPNTAVASADHNDQDPGSVSAAPSKSKPARAGRTVRGKDQHDRTAPATATTRTSGQSADPRRSEPLPTRKPEDHGPTPAAATAVAAVAPSATARITTDNRPSGHARPVAARSAAAPIAPTDRAPMETKPGIAAARTARATTAALTATPSDPGMTIATAVNNFFDSATKWLSGLPANPLTEFLQGALLLVRRTLFGFIPTVSSNPTGGQTVTATPYLSGQELRDYLLSLAQQQYGGQFGQTLPVYDYYPYPEYLKQLDGPDTGIQSGTNTQVTGVDEADFVETDGNYVYVARNNALTILDAGSNVSSQTAFSGYVVGEFLSGDRLTVITQSGGGWYGPYVKMAPGHFWNWNPQTTVTVYDVSDRTAPTVTAQTVFDGAYQDARAVDGTVYLVMDRSVNLPAPLYTDEPIAVDDPMLLAEKNRYGGQAIAYRTYETWDEYVARVGDQIVTLSLPHAYSVDIDGNLVDLGAVAGGGDIVKPTAAEQQSMLTVVSVDSHDPGTAGFASSVATFVSSNGTTVYMTPGALYLATAQDNYSDTGSSTDTRIDRFTIDGTELGWQASGVVTGTLINQFAMDEQDGYLRVATHNWSAQFAGGTWATVNDSGVYVLDTAGGTLDVVGGVTGLAPGEQLYAVRFAGDKAYLVTFLRTDPLFVVDLSDPAAPTVQGELVIPGFSNYLQSVGDGLLIGIGQEPEAGTWNTRLHVSLFDVADGGTPTLVDRQFLGGSTQWSSSEAQWDHHALLYSPEDGLLVVPLSAAGYDPQTGDYRYGQTLQVLRVTSAGVDVLGAIPTDGSVLRTVRIGDVLYAVSEDHVTAYSLADFSEIGHAPLGTADPDPVYALS